MFRAGGFDQITFKPFAPGWSKSMMVIEAKK
jgi:hypothetical protein